VKNNVAQKYVNAHRQAMGASQSGFRNAYGSTTLANSPSMTGQKPAGWNANGTANAMPSSKPFLLQISNASAAAVSNFAVFGANLYLTGAAGGGTWSSNGNFTLNGVTISVVSGGLNYQQFLSASQQKPFTIGCVYLKSIAGSTDQVNDTYQLASVSQSGQTYSEPITPFIDPYQQQNNITVENTLFNIDGLTTLTWQTIYASAVFSLRLFPAQQIDPTQVLNGQSAGQVNGAPKVYGTLR
jgi:hypothetical protein